VSLFISCDVWVIQVGMVENLEIPRTNMHISVSPMPSQPTRERPSNGDNKWFFFSTIKNV